MAFSLYRRGAWRSGFSGRLPYMQHFHFPAVLHVRVAHWPQGPERGSRGHEKVGPGQFLAGPHDCSGVRLFRGGVLLLRGRRMVAGLSGACHSRRNSTRQSGGCYGGVFTYGRLAGRGNSDGLRVSRRHGTDRASGRQERNREVHQDHHAAAVCADGGDGSVLGFAPRLRRRGEIPAAS